MVEWAVEEAVQTVIIPSTPGDHDAYTITDLVWDVDEADRFIALAINFNNLLNYQEEILFKLIREKRNLWLTKEDMGKKLGTWDRLLKADLKIVRACFEDFKRVCEGTLSENELDSKLKKLQKQENISYFRRS